MKKFLLGIVGLAAASTVNAATVTFTLSIGDDGSGAFGIPGSFAIYADVSQADNSGLFAFGVDLVDGSIDTIVNMSPTWLYRHTPLSGSFPTRFAGFGTGISEDAATGKISGVTDLARGTLLLPVYGFGQKDIDLNAFTPTGPRPTGYNLSIEANPNEPGPLVKAHMLLGIGTYSPGHLPAWPVGSVDNAASVYDTVQDSTGTKNTAVVPVLVTGPGCFSFSQTMKNLAPTCTPFSVSLGGTLDNANVATGGAIVVTGSNGKYNSEVDSLTADSLVRGSAPIQTIGDEAGSIYVLMGLNGTPADIAAVNTDFNAINATDPQYATLHLKYDSKFAGGVDAIFKFDNTTGAKVVNFDFSSHANVTVDQIAAVPEPSITILALASLSLLTRRRRRP